MATNDTYISVWHDETSDEHGWIVDRCDQNDNSETVKCYLDDDYGDGEERARAFAECLSEKTGLPIRE